MAKKSKRKSKRWFVGLRQRREAKKAVSGGFIGGFMCERCGCLALVVYSSSLVNDKVLCAGCFYSSCDRAAFVVW